MATATNHQNLSEAIENLDFDSTFTICEGKVQTTKEHTPEVMWDGSAVQVYGDWEVLPFSNIGDGTLCHPSECVSEGMAQVLEERLEEFSTYALTVVYAEDAEDDEDNIAGWTVIGKTA